MSTSQAVNIECYGNIKKIPMPNPFITVEKLKDIVRNRLRIDYPFTLTHKCAELCDEDSFHDLAIGSNEIVRVRRSSVDESRYVSTSDSIDPMTDIFLSYEQAHRNIVEELKKELEERTYSCWLDIERSPEDLNNFSPTIQQAISKSTVFICCITGRYVRSMKCQQELRFAKEHGKKTILLLMEDLPWPSPQIEGLVSGLDCIQFYPDATSASLTPWRPEKFRELRNKLSVFIPQM